MKPKIPELPEVPEPKEAPTPIRPPTPLEAAGSQANAARAIFRPQGQNSLISAGRLTTKPITRKASLLG